MSIVKIPSAQMSLEEIPFAQSSLEESTFAQMSIDLAQISLGENLFRATVSERDSLGANVPWQGSFGADVP